VVKDVDSSPSGGPPQPDYISERDYPVGAWHLVLTSPYYFPTFRVFTMLRAIAIIDGVLPAIYADPSVAFYIHSNYPCAASEAIKRKVDSDREILRLEPNR
jgi:hypothetical protein